MEVLDALEECKKSNAFDEYSVGYVASKEDINVQKAPVRRTVDPILFGKIYKCPDLFFIAEWDEDVKFEDLHKITRANKR